MIIVMNTDDNEKKEMMWHYNFKTAGEVGRAALIDYINEMVEKDERVFLFDETDGWLKFDEEHFQSPARM